MKHFDDDAEFDEEAFAQRMAAHAANNDNHMAMGVAFLKKGFIAGA